MPPESPDSVLIEQVAAGQEAAFRILWERYAPRVRKVLQQVTSDREEQNDALQEASIRIWRALSEGKYQEEGKFFGWICTVARNSLITSLRRRPRCCSTDDLSPYIPSPTHNTEATAIRRIAMERLYQAIHACFEEEAVRLTAPQAEMRRLAFLWYYLGDYTLVEVTEMLAWECALRHWEAPSASALNNWLGGGRILKVWAKYILTHYREELEELAPRPNSSLDEAALVQRLRLRFREMKKISEDPAELKESRVPASSLDSSNIS